MLLDVGLMDLVMFELCVEFVLEFLTLMLIVFVNEYMDLFELNFLVVFVFFYVLKLVECRF